MNTAARWVCSFAGAIALACGGQVETSGDSASNGGSGTTAGSAGSDGSGGFAGSSGGVGGSSGVAGSSGGVAGSSGGVAGSSGGVAGSSGGVAGSSGGAGIGGVAGIGGNAGSGAGGAMTGGAAGAGGAPLDIGTKMRRACAVLQSSGCGLSPADCTGALSSLAQQMASYGCVPEFVAALDCVIATRAFCQDMSQCAAAMESMTRCMAPNSCTEYGSSDGSCGAACGDWAADCRPGPPGRLSCVCTQGPRAGASFVSLDLCNSPNWQASVRAVCAFAP